MKFDHSTPDQLIQRVKSEMKTATGFKLLKLARYMKSLNLNPADIARVFAVDQKDVGKVTARLKQLSDKLDEVKAEKWA